MKKFYILISLKTLFCKKIAGFDRLVKELENPLYDKVKDNDDLTFFVFTKEAAADSYLNLFNQYVQAAEDLNSFSLFKKEIEEHAERYSINLSNSILDSLEERVIELTNIKSENWNILKTMTSKMKDAI